MTDRESERLRKVRVQAQLEMDEENFKADVEAMKAKLREGRWWHSVFPYQIILRKRV